MIVKATSFYQFLRRPTLVWLLLLMGLAASTRLFNLDLLGPFIDETSHIYFFDDFSLYKKVSLGGKVLGFIIFYGTTRWTGDPLYASRLLIAGVGVLTTVGIFLTTQHLGGKKAAVLAGLIWALLPYVTFHDRLALHDPLISFFLTWATFFFLVALKQQHGLTSWLSGLLLGLAIATKPTALIGGMWLLLLSLAYIDLKELKKYTTVFLALIAGVMLPLLVILAILIPHLNDFWQYTDHFVNTSATNLTRWQLFLTNMAKVRDWFDGYTSIFFEILILLTFILVILKPSKIKLTLLLSFVISLAAYAFFFQVWFSRYLLPTLIPLVILAALVGSEWLTGTITTWQNGGPDNKWITTAVTVLLFVLLALSIPSWVFTHLTLQTNPLEAKIPGDDQFQYFNGWPSGAGLAEVGSFLDQLTENSSKKILVITGGFGQHGFWSLPMMMKDNPRIEFRHLATNSRQEALQIIVDAAKRKTLILQEPPKGFIPNEIASFVSPLPALIFEYHRPQAEGGFQIYELAPMIYLKLPPDQVRASINGDLPAIIDIFSPQARKQANRDKVIWFNQTFIAVTVAASRAGVLQLEGELIREPDSVDNKKSYPILIKTSSGYNEVLEIEQEQMTTEIPIEAGATELLLIPLDQPGEPTQTEDNPLPRLGMKELSIINFR